MKKKWFTGLVPVLLILAVGFMGCDTDGGGGSGPTYEWETDVVVVGGGLSGISAALSAVQEGASVILVEKRSTLGGVGGGGALGAPNSIVQIQNGIVDTAQSWLAGWYKRANQVRAPYRNWDFPVYSDVEWLVNGSPVIIDWLLSVGMTFHRPCGLAQDVPERFHYMNNAGYIGSGAGVVAFLNDVAEPLGLDVRLETKAVKVLLEDGPGSRAVGIELEDGSLIYAKAVILAAGGFMSDLSKYISGGIKYSAQSDFSLGEGIQMAEEAGAVLWEDPWVNGIGLSAGDPGIFVDGGMNVDKSGTRIGFEGGNVALQTTYAMCAQLDGGYLYTIGSRDTALDLTPEQQASGMVFQADSIAGLAAAAGIDADKLAESVAEYNGIADAVNALNAANAPDERYIGVDPLDVENFNTNPNKLPMAPNLAMFFPPWFTNATRKTYTKIDNNYYVALVQLPSIMGTFGGVKTKTGTSEVLDKDNPDRAIPGLYAAGENANRNFYDKVYMSGSATMQAVSTGRAAGIHAAVFAAANN
jgi:fumarate reductase flavoprotein subunit